MPFSRRDFLLAAAAVALDASCSAAIKEPACSTQPPTCPAPNALERCELFAFDEIHRATPLLFQPCSEAELARFLTTLPEKRRVTIRGGGQSLGDQSLNDDTVVLMDKKVFGTIDEPQRDDDGFFITTGAAARWWDVLTKIAPLGLVPRSLVTANLATLGGTLSADCVSRQSPIAGKEGDQIRSFTILLADGRSVVVPRSAKDLPKSDERRNLWDATIGGFGYLGAVTSVTVDLLVARSNPGVCGLPPRVFTRATRHGANVDWDTVLRSLHEKTYSARTRFKNNKEKHLGAKRFASKRLGAKADEVPLAAVPEWSALSIASFLEGPGMSANLLEQRFVEGDVPLNPVGGGFYDATAAFPAIAETLTPGWPTFVELGAEMGFPEGEFVDELFGWSFFLGNSLTVAKQKMHASGSRLNFTQQSFALPSGPNPARPDTRETRRFIELMEARLHAADLRPADIDFLWIPADEFSMSASRGLSGFVVTVAIADINRTTLAPAIDETLRALSHDCRTLGGRVHLVKNVVADASDLRAMHGDAAKELIALKQQFDPKGIFKNDFFQRVFCA